MMRYLYRPTKTSKFKHKVLVIGDDTAVGFGDWITCGARPGVCPPLQEILRRKRQLQHQWTCVNAGVLGSTSDDWRPDAAESASSTRWWSPFGASLFNSDLASKGTLWKDVFDAPRYNDAEIVVVCVGMNDHAATSVTVTAAAAVVVAPGASAEAKKKKQKEHAAAAVALQRKSLSDNPERSMANVKRMVTKLLAMGKRVFVCTTPLHPHGVREGCSDADKQLWLDRRARNTLISSGIGAWSLDEPRLQLGAHLGGSSFMRAEYFHRDKQHFSSTGYRQFAAALADCVELACTRVEFIHNRSELLIADLRHAKKAQKQQQAKAKSKGGGKKAA
jgi:lysophospholipase L1-like esterase